MSAPAHTTRFAPSLTGRLHLGHAFAALMAFEAAAGGEFVLRIEDLDRERARSQYEAAICTDLAWLGLHWKEPRLHQSTRASAYQVALARLAEWGLSYPCFCTRAAIRAELARAGEAPHILGGAASGGTAGESPGHGLYPGTCRRLPPGERQRRVASGEPHAIRLDVQRALEQVGALQFSELGSGPSGEHGLIAVRAETLGDIVLARRDLPAAYHLAVVIDDAFQGITLVTRGQDLFMATHLQRLLQALLHLPVPQYAHHRLICDARGYKLSKRDQAPTLQSLREQGADAAQIRRRLELSPAEPP